MQRRWPRLQGRLPNGTLPCEIMSDMKRLMVLAFLAMAESATNAQTMTTLIGNGYVFDGDGKPGLQAALGLTYSAAIHPRTGEVHFADIDNCTVLRLRADGVLFVVAGNGRPGFSGDGGPATEASLSALLKQIAFDRQGNLYIVDAANSRVRKVDANGIISTVAGNNRRGRAPDGAVAAESSLDYPHGVAVDSKGNLYIADHFNLQIRKVDTAGRTTIYAGNGTQAATGDGGPAVRASLGKPIDMAIDTADNLYFGASS